MVTTSSSKVANGSQEAQKKRRALIPSINLVLLENRQPDLKMSLSDSGEHGDSISPLVARFYLQAVARKILRGRKFAVSRCLRALIPNKKTVEIHINETDKRTKYVNLQTCKSVWVCPVCAARITERRRADVQAAILAWQAKGGRVVFATYTLAHQIEDSLYSVFGSLKAARRFTKGGRTYQTIKEVYGVVGSIAATEITYGENGWHPHIHELLFVKHDIQVSDLENDLRARWVAALSLYGRSALPEIGFQLEIVDKKIADYVAKFGHLPVGGGWSSSHEMTKSQQKRSRGKSLTPWGLLEVSAEVDTDELFCEYATVTKGTRQIVFSAGLTALLGLQVEEDEDILADNQPEYLPLASLSHYVWQQILQEPSVVRGKILEVARGGYEALRDYLLTLHINIAAPDSIESSPVAVYSSPEPESLQPTVFKRWEFKAYMDSLLGTEDQS